MNFEELGNLFVLYGLNVLYALGLLIVGWWVATLVDRAVTRALASTHRVDITVIGFIGSLAKYTVLAFVGVAVLQRFGIQTTSIIAVLGAASLAIGLALQGTLSNLAAGVMLLLFRPFRVGDSVEVAGRAGTVKNLTLFTTELASGDNVQVLIPNGQVWGSAIVNQSAYGERRLDLTVEMKPGGDIDGTIAEGLAFLQNDPRTNKSPGPSANVAKFTLDKVEIAFSAWAKAADAGSLKADLVRRLRSRLAPGLPEQPQQAALSPP
ncbi:mechanosensitive ion channel [Starkeya sp. ORNL1]|uniref:mechanosensitive ion channel family protein n=1 Tax=Starkeya sp. ORNL1 TaxID=2709380 RepID=UPI0014649297|nr:mechanosensitive ion channel domain-containing protein [Starkeya sp. ORNL1]QJP13170.1 mechanosensitive ion channel [Starkeya sp. ORNL1]